MDLDTLLTEAEKKLIQHFLHGRAIISRYDQETEEVRYMFNIMGGFYYYIGNGGYSSEMTDIGPDMTISAQRSAMAMILDGNIKYQNLDSYFTRFPQGSLLDLPKVGKIYLSPEGKYYLCECSITGHFWYHEDSQYQVVSMFMKCYASFQGKMPAGIIRGIDQKELDRLKEDLKGPGDSSME